jgi:hypothetical protein
MKGAAGDGAARNLAFSLGGAPCQRANGGA